MCKKNSLKMYCVAVKYMEEHLFEKMYVVDVAMHCGVSTSGLEKTFKKFGEAGVMRYFLDKKLEYAAKMLKKGDSVNHLAKVLNFASPAHLSMAFKKKYGVSPLKYKYPLLQKSKN